MTTPAEFGAEAAPRPWARLREGDGRVILAVDFPATGRPEAGFANLAEHLCSGHGLWETCPPESDPAAWTAPHLVRWWADEVRACGVEVSAVLGFCASSAYALALARELQGPGPRLPVILFDPTTVDREVLYEFGFARVIGMFRGVLATDEFDAAVRRALHARDTEPGLRELATALDRIYLDTAATAFTRVGLSPGQAGELSEIVTGHLHHLRVAGELASPDAAGADPARADATSPNPADNATAIRSADYPGSMPTADSIPCPFEHNVILAEEWTGRTLSALLEGALR